MATKDKNAGAINARPPAKGPMRERFIRVRELAAEEFTLNRKAKNGEPTSWTQWIVAMGEARYAKELGAETADEQRKEEETKEAPAATSWF